MAAQSREEFINLMLKSEHSEKITQELLTKAKKEYTATKQPIYKAYLGIGNLFMAKHATFPWAKMSYFNTGKNFLDSAVNEAPKNLEIRFLRYTTQMEMPKILGYNKNKQEDKDFILQHYKTSSDEVLVAQIKDYFKSR